MVYALTGMVGDGLEREAAALDVEHWGLKVELTRDEAAYLENDAPSAEQCAANSYRLHAAHAILWALGMVSSLENGDPDSVTEEATKLLRARSMASLTANISFRAIDEILDEDDFYRLYSAAYATIVPAGTTIGLEPEVGPAPMPVANERLRGLEWLLSVS